MGSWCNWPLVVWAFIVILLRSHFDLSEIIAFARYLPVTPALPVTSETCPLPLDYSTENDSRRRFYAAFCIVKINWKLSSLFCFKSWILFCSNIFLASFREMHGMVEKGVFEFAGQLLPSYSSPHNLQRLNTTQILVEFCINLLSWPDTSPLFMNHKTFPSFWKLFYVPFQTDMASLLQILRRGSHNKWLHWPPSYSILWSLVHAAMLLFMIVEGNQPPMMLVDAESLLDVISACVWGEVIS